MGAAKRNIEIDEATAIALEARAAEAGLSLSDLLAQMTSDLASPAEISDDALDELDRQWEAIRAGEPTVPHEEVARWLRTWGTSAFRPWHSR